MNDIFEGSRNSRHFYEIDMSKASKKQQFWKDSGCKILEIFYVSSSHTFSTIVFIFLLNNLLKRTNLIEYESFSLAVDWDKSVNFEWIFGAYNKRIQIWIFRLHMGLQTV